MHDNLVFFFNHAVYEITWGHIVELERPQMAVWCMRFADWIAKATNPYPEYVYLLLFPTATIFASTHLNVTLYVVGQ